MISISLPDHPTERQMAAALAFFQVLQSGYSSVEVAEEVRQVTVSVANPTQDVTAMQRVVEALEKNGAQGQSVCEEEGCSVLHPHDIPSPVPAPSAVFGGAAAPAPLSELSATAAPVPVPSSTIPEPSSAPAAAVPGPVITDVAAAIGLPTPSAPALDKEGLPWDHRIHAESKAQNQDGTWRKKRGVTDEEFARVKGEMKAMLGGAQVPGPTAASGVTASPAPAATPTPPAPVGDSGFGALMLWVQNPMMSNPPKLTMSDLNAAIGNYAPVFGIEPPAGGFNISTIKLAPAPMIAMIRAELGTLAASRGWVDEVAS